MMNKIDKINAATQRIKELTTLINHWSHDLEKESTNIKRRCEQNLSQEKERRCIS